MKSINELIDRIEVTPTEHLGARSIDGLNSYINGYGMALDAAKLPRLVGQLSPPILLPESFSGMSIQTYSLLQSEDEHEAFGQFLQLRKESVQRLCRMDENTNSVTYTWPNSSGLLEKISVLLLRPAMYLGTVSAANLWAFIRGYEWAENDHGMRSTDMQQLHGFSRWLCKRYRTGRPWFAIFRALEVGSNLDDVQHFATHLTMYLKGDRPDEPYTNDETILTKSLEKAITTFRKVSVQPKVPRGEGETV